MKEQHLQIGDILWHVLWYRKKSNAPMEYYAVPICIEHIDAHSFSDYHCCGGSLTLIGKTYFHTRGECLQYLNAHKKELEKQAIAITALKDERPQIGSLIPDNMVFWKGEDQLSIITGHKVYGEDDLCWKIATKEDREYGFGYYITLADIKEQFGQNERLITVICEGPLKGSIYQTGNYPPATKWRLHGCTEGYA